MAGSTTYARARLRIGILGVGTWVLVAAALLASGAHVAPLERLDARAPEALVLFGTLALFAVAALPFDLLGGHVLPRRYGRRPQGFGAFVVGWLRGVAMLLVVTTACGLALLAAGRAGGVPLALAVFVLLQLALVAAQLPLARAVGGLRATPIATSRTKGTRHSGNADASGTGTSGTGTSGTGTSGTGTSGTGTSGTGTSDASASDASASDAGAGDAGAGDAGTGPQHTDEHDTGDEDASEQLPVDTLVLGGTDEGFTGGIVGFGGTLVLPERWTRDLDPRALSILVERRRSLVRRGARRLAIALAIAWNTVGLALALALPGAGVTTVTELVTAALGFTLWSFVGLLILPAPTRRATHAADAAVATDAAARADLGRAIEALDRLQDDEPERSAAVESVFHPTPSVHGRLAALHAGAVAPSPGAWHLARTALFLGHAGLSLLPRAVHCNTGRPELWVLLPTDG